MGIKLIFSWKPSQNAKKYTIEISKTDDFDSLIFTEDASDTSIAIKLPIGVYYWRISGTNKIGLTGKWAEAFLPYGLFAPITLPGTHSVRHVIETSDRGVAVAGNTIDGDLFGNILFSKYDLTGSLEWSREYLGIKKYVRVEYFEEIKTGGYLLVGWTLAGLEDDPYHYETDENAIESYLIKTDQNGNIEWETTLHDSAWDLGMHVCQNEDNTFTVLSKQGTIYSDSIISLYQVDTNGNLLWEKHYDSLYAVGRGIIIKSDNNGYIIATSHSISEMDINGNIVWTSYYNNSAWTVNTLIKTTENFIVEASNDEGDIGMQIFIFDLAGNLIDSIKYDNLGQYHIISGQHIQATDEDDFIIAGYDIFVGKSKIMRVGYNFSTIWQMDLDDINPIIQKTPGDGFLVGTRNNIYKINSEGEMY